MKFYGSSSEEILWGRQVVKEALRARNAQKLYLEKKEAKGSYIKEVTELAQNKNIPINYLNPEEFKKLTGSETATGGVAVSVPLFKYWELDDLLTHSRASQEPSLILILDHVEDPQNLGALLRTAEAAGAVGVVLPRDRAAGVTPTVRRVSAGAAEWLPVVQVTNLARVVEILQGSNYWIYGAEGVGNTLYYKADWNRKVALVMGSEGKGISRLVKDKCDVLLNIPMAGQISSLNVSVAAGILIYEHVRHKQR